MENKPPPTETRKYWLWIGVGALILVVMAALAGVFIGGALIMNYQTHSLPPKPPEATPSGTPITPTTKSKLATDSAVINSRDGLNKLLDDINTMDYFEAQIAPPAIDTSIKIE